MKRSISRYLEFTDREVREALKAGPLSLIPQNNQGIERAMRPRIPILAK